MKLLIHIFSETKVIEMEFAVKCLKHRLRSEHTVFTGHATEYNQISDLISRTSDHGESNSALIIGTAGCGKTTVIFKSHVKVDSILHFSFYSLFYYS